METLFLVYKMESYNYRNLSYIIMFWKLLAVSRCFSSLLQEVSSAPLHHFLLSVVFSHFFVLRSSLILSHDSPHFIYVYHFSLSRLHIIPYLASWQVLSVYIFFPAFSFVIFSRLCQSECTQHRPQHADSFPCAVWQFDFWSQVRNSFGNLRSVSWSGLRQRQI